MIQSAVYLPFRWSGSFPNDLVGHTFRLVLLTTSYLPDLERHEIYGDVSGELEASGGYSVGGEVLTGLVADVDTSDPDPAAHFAYLAGDDVVWAALTPSTAFRYAVLYDTTDSNRLVMLIDFGTNQDPAGGEFRVPWGRRNGVPLVLTVVSTPVFGPDRVVGQATIPPFDGSWLRSPRNPFLAPSQSWEETSCQEPSVLVEDGRFRLWYMGGWAHPALGYAECLLSEDPTDPANWIKHSGPVFGQGGSGYGGLVAHGGIVKVDGTYYLYFADFPSLHRASSSDGISWTEEGIVLAGVSGSQEWANPLVWVEGATWYMLSSGRSSFSDTWGEWLLSSADGLSWGLLNGGNRLSSLQAAIGGMYGTSAHGFVSRNGILSPKIGDRYHLWYHAAPTSGNLPTDIYHATSIDKIDWTVTGRVLQHLGSGIEVDQVADACPVVVDEVAYLFYDALNNPAEQGRLGIATAAARR